MPAPKANGTLMAHRGLGHDHRLAFSQVELGGLEPPTPCLQTEGKTSTAVCMCRSASQSVHTSPPGSWPVAVLSCCTVQPLASRAISHGRPLKQRKPQPQATKPRSRRIEAKGPCTGPGPYQPPPPQALSLAALPLHSGPSRSVPRRGRFPRPGWRDSTRADRRDSGTDDRLGRTGLGSRVRRGDSPGTSAAPGLLRSSASAVTQARARTIAVMAGRW